MHRKIEADRGREIGEKQEIYCKSKGNRPDDKNTKAFFDGDRTAALYRRAFREIGNKTPLFKDCGVLCGKACCKGDKETGMRLFPKEETALTAVSTPDGGRLCVCEGNCDRKTRPLGCRIFPLFPILHDDGHISAELDARGFRLCPLVENAEKVRFSKDFRKAVRKAGRILCRDKQIRAYIKEVSEEIEQTAKLCGISYKITKRK